jgi:type IV pilus assembly protein PilE
MRHTPPLKLALRAARGLTLIELMVALAVVAILTAVALPAYNGYVQRSRVPAALDGLIAIALRMEQRFQDNGSYGGDGNCPGALPTATHFDFVCTVAGGGTTFTATATGSGAMVGYGYTINQAGTRVTTAHPKGVPGGNCWSLRGGSCDS